ncbi:MAG: hypothetical protein V4495_22430, partial [Pseudomonadota bacterium]
KFALEVEGFTVRVFASPAQVLAAGALPKLGCLVIDYHLPTNQSFIKLREPRCHKSGYLHCLF